MIAKISRFILITAFVFSVHYCNAQKRYLFRTYTTSDGLINNTIFSINQDRNGYIWLGTDAGVSKFNGYNFDNTVVPEINKNEVFCQYIDKDKSGRLIISAFMEGVLKEQENSSYKQYLVQKKSIGKNVVRTTKVCPDGTVLTSVGHTLYALRDDSFRLVYNFSETNRSIFNSIEYDSNKNIWFGGYQGLGILFPDAKTYTPFFFPELKDILVLNILFVKSNVLLVGTKSGFYRFTFKSMQRGKLLYTVEKPFAPLNDVTINHIYKDRQHNIWISTSTVGVFKTRENQITDHISFENGLPSASVMCVFQDTENNYWFGTPDGVSKLVSFANYSLSYQGEPLKGVGLFAKDKDNRLWIWDGTSLYLSKNDSVKNISLKNTSFEDEGMESFLLTQTDVLIFAQSGLYKMPLKDDVNLRNAKKIVDFEKANVSRIRCTEIDPEGIIWIGFDQGLYAIRNNKLIRCEIRSEKEITLRPAQIVKDKYGYYWVGDFSFGLYRFKYDNTMKDKIVFDKMNEYKSLKADSAFVTAWVQDMIFDHKGDLWMSTLYTGVYKLSQVTSLPGSMS